MRNENAQDMNVTVKIYRMANLCKHTVVCQIVSAVGNLAVNGVSADADCNKPENSKVE